VPVDADLPLSARLSWAARFALEHLTTPGGAAAARLEAGRRALVAGLTPRAGWRRSPPKAVAEGEPSPEAFSAGQSARLEPRVFRGAAKDWVCVRRWSLEDLARRFASDPVRLFGIEGLKRGTSEGHETVAFAEFARRMLGGSGDYLRFAPFALAHPELGADLDQDWLAARGWSRGRDPLQFFIGGQGGRTPMHCELPGNFSVQVLGRKRWTLHPPGTLLFLDPPAARRQYCFSEAADAPRPERYPLYELAERYETVLEPGDVLWNPPFWWHDVVNLSPVSIGVSCRVTSLSQALRTSPLLTAARCLARNPNIAVGLLEMLRGRYTIYPALDARSA
jgi:hypothetical protein